MKTFIAFILYTIWIAGIVIADGLWKILALFPLYAYYVVIEKILKVNGWL